MAIAFIASTRGPTSFPGSENNTSSVACAKPSGTVAGHVMLAFCTSGGDAHHTAPSGWSTVSRYEYVAGNLTTTIFYKVAGSEPSSYTFTDDEGGLTPMCVEILTYSGVDTTNPINVHTESSTAGTDTTSAPSATSTATGRYIWFRAGKTATVSSEGSFTTSGGTARQRTSNRGGSTQYFVQSVDSSGGDLPPGTRSGASFNSSVTLTASIQRTVVLKTPGTPGTGSISSTLGKVAASFTGNRIMPTGPLAAALPATAVAFEGTAAPPSGDLDTLLPSLGASLTGTATGGPLSAVLPAATASLAGGIIHGDFAGTLAGVTSTWDGAVNPTGPVDATLPMLLQDFVVETRPHGDNVIVVEDEKRAFRISQDRMVDIYRSDVVISFDGPTARLDAVLPALQSIFRDPFGDAGVVDALLPAVDALFPASLANDGLLAAPLPRLEVDLPGVSESADDAVLDVTLPSLGGDFEGYNAVTWVAAGDVVSGTGDITVPLPTSYQVYDVLLLAVSAEEGDAIAAPDGWTQIDPSPQVSGVSDTGNQLGVFWLLADGAETAPVVADTGDHAIAVIHAFRGVDTVDGPVDADGGIFQTSEDTAATMPAVSTSTPDEMVVYVGGHGVSSVDGQATLNTLDAELINAAERTNASTTDGAGGGLYVYTASSPEATFIDSATFTLATPSLTTGVVVALLTLTSGGVGSGGALAATLPSLSCDFRELPSAALDVVLPSLTSSFAGENIQGPFLAALPRPVTAMSATLSDPGTVDTSLPALSTSFTGNSASEDLLKFAQSVGNGSSTSFTVTHNLNSRDVVVAVYDNSTQEDVLPQSITRTSVNAVTVTFPFAPATNAYRVVVLYSSI